MNKAWLWVIVVIIIAAGGYLYMKDNQRAAPVPQETANPITTPTPTTTQSASPAAAMEQTIQLAEQNTSGESGTAILTESNGKVTVTLNVTGGAAEVAQPAHIHVGACPNVGAVAYPLTDVANGKSVTVLDVSLADLAGKQPLGINVHKSAKDLKVYVSCGDLNLSSSAPVVSTGDTKIKY